MSNDQNAPQQWDSKSIHERVTARIIERLEEGVVPWHIPHIATVGFPENYHSKQRYRGINVMLLAMAGYASPHFLTYRQASELGGQVRKGEKGLLVVKFGTVVREKPDGGEEIQRFLRHYTVFNACQIDGVDFPEVPIPSHLPSERTDIAREIVAGMPQPPTILEGVSVHTCYDLQKDCVEIPARGWFETEERFYKSLFHELVHSTGAANRLARKTLLDNRGISMSDKTIYGREELVAEIGAAFLCAHAGIVMDDHENTVAYISGWLEVLRDPKNQRWIVEAAGQAQKACDYVLNVEPQL